MALGGWGLVLMVCPPAAVHVPPFRPQYLHYSPVALEDSRYSSQSPAWCPAL